MTFLAFNSSFSSFFLRTIEGFNASGCDEGVVVESKVVKAAPNGVGDIARRFRSSHIFSYYMIKILKS